MGVILWGESPIYVNPVNVLNTLAKVLAEGKGGIVKFCLKAEQSGRGNRFTKSRRYRESIPPDIEKQNKEEAVIFEKAMNPTGGEENSPLPD